MATTARFLVLWGTPQDPAEFDRHYREVHVPLARKLPGLRRYTLAVLAAGADVHSMVYELDDLC